MHPGQKLKPGALRAVRGHGRRADGRGARAAVLRPADDPAVGRDGRRRRRADRRDRARAAAALHQARRHARRIASAIRRCSPRARGSVAAPTAGLHFTPALLAAIDAAASSAPTITLHVGYGTFKPVRVDERRGPRRSIPSRTRSRPRPRRRSTRALDDGRRVDRGRHDDDARAGGCGARAASGRSRAPGRADARRCSSIPGFEFRVDRRAAHELPSAEVVAADAGGRVRRPRARARGVPRGRRASATASTAMATRC